MTLEKQCADLLARAGLSDLGLTLTKLAGEASYREYFRLHLPHQPSLIIMKMPTGIQSASEEAIKKVASVSELPFINIQKYLKRLELRVPEILGHDTEHGLLLLQDLGDQSFEKTARQANCAQLSFFYRQAIDLLIRFQTATVQHPDQNCLAFLRRFDQDLLMWEFDHFIEFGIEDRLAKQMPPDDRSTLRAIGARLVKEMTQIPQLVVHRDFQSRNLILHGYELWMIDFQDALIGPSTYDLVALLRDSYISLDQEMIDQLIAYYISQLPPDHPHGRKSDGIIRAFNVTTVQRKLKDAGRFQYIHTVKKNPSFLPNVAPSLGYVRQALARLADYEDMVPILSRYLPEFAEART